MSALFPIQTQPSWGSSLRPPVSHPPWEISASTQRGPVQTASAGSCGRHPSRPSPPMAELPRPGGQSQPQPELPHRPIQSSTPCCKSPWLLPSTPMGCREHPTAVRARGRDVGSRVGEFRSSGQRGQPHRLTIASQGEDSLGADGTCSARERAFLLLMLSGGNASQAFRMAL